ncbi:unnamed protein product [Coregonus sp. 'balchen']|nr:unnamed protein product [Coregonus sp. 'balchen']
MALQDFCGFQDTPMSQRALFLSAVTTDTVPFLPVHLSITAHPPPIPFVSRNHYPGLCVRRRCYSSSRHTCQLLRACLLRYCPSTPIYWSPLQAVVQTACYERESWPEIRLYQLRHGRRLSITGSAKLVSHMLHPFKGTDVCVAATLCGWDVEEIRVEKFRGQKVDRMGSGRDSISPAKVPLEETGMSASDYCSQDDLTGSATIVVAESCSMCAVMAPICRESSSQWAQVRPMPMLYWMEGSSGACEEEAISLAREAVYRATHRDAYSGNCVDLFHITAQGYSRKDREDLREEYQRERETVLKMVKE